MSYANKEDSDKKCNPIQKNITHRPSACSHTSSGASQLSPSGMGGVAFQVVFMGKDPAFLFYPGDWLGGTITMTRAHKGAYMDILMAQFNSGHLNEKDIKEVLGKDYPLWDDKLKSKFSLDENGCYYNERLELEAKKRRSFTESRRKNRANHMNEHMSNHMIGHMENENRDININTKKVSKSKYGEYKNVLLTEKEHSQLKARFKDKVAEKIKQLDEGIELKGYKYKSHYLAILKWAEKDTPKPKTTKLKGFPSAR